MSVAPIVENHPQSIVPQCLATIAIRRCRGGTAKDRNEKARSMRAFQESAYGSRLGLTNDVIAAKTQAMMLSRVDLLEDGKCLFIGLASLTVDLIACFCLLCLGFFF